MKKGRHQEFSFRDGPRSYEFGRHERHEHAYHSIPKLRCIGCGSPRPPVITAQGPNSSWWAGTITGTNNK